MLTSLLFACHAEKYPPDQTELVYTVREYVDPARPTPAVGGVQGADRRVLPTHVWIGPSAGEDAPDRPLLLMLHGLDGHPDKFDRFARTLAEAGIVVAAPAFPVSNRDAGGGANSIVDLAEQIRDVRFVIERLLGDVRGEGDGVDGSEEGPLWARFSEDRIAALGHSMGGATLLGDSRFGEGNPYLVAQIYVAAAMQLEPLIEGEFSAAGPPTLVATGLEDDTVPPAFAESLFASIEEPKWYLGIAGAGHSDALESQEDPTIPAQVTALDAVLATFDTAVHGQAGALDTLFETLAAEGHTTL